MCGISGFIDFNRATGRDVLEKMTRTLAHRGPDGEGYAVFEKEKAVVGLGHRRLSIIDLSAGGSQPKTFQQLHITFNGEIYNYESIRNELIDKGHSFDSHSDTEVVLHAYKEWGADALSKFIGMFGFTIYDEAKHELFCVRDRAGVKPFYYYWHNGLFLFASELKAFHQHPSFKKEINVQALHQFLQYGFIMAPNSIFNNTQKLLPGHYLKMNLETGAMQTHKYWDVFDAYNAPRLSITEAEAITQTKELLTSACKYRMVADVPVGVFLSGGYDSTAVTALLQTTQTDKLKTFTIGFNEKEHNEAEYAKEVAGILGTDHTEYYCTVKEAQDIIPDIPLNCDEPFGDSSIIPTTLVSRLARKSVAVALSADAGDEVFAGYNKYTRALQYLNRINTVPSFLRSSAGAILNAVPDGLLNTAFNNTAAALKKQRFAGLLQDKETGAAQIMDKVLSQVFTTPQLHKLLASTVEAPFSFHNHNSKLGAQVSQLDKMLAIDYKTYLVDDILVKVDRATMSVSLEGREPLLDHRLVEFAAQLPSTLKIKDGVKKFALKEIVHQYIPAAIMNRPKKGFTVPVFNWLRTDLRFYADEYLNHEALKEHGLFNLSEVDSIKNNFFKGDTTYDSLFWYLLMFQMWYKKWM
jgi:asparagine synthase (glutamine-hydrolysing)